MYNDNFRYLKESVPISADVATGNSQVRLALWVSRIIIIPLDSNLLYLVIRIWNSVILKNALVEDW